MKRMFTKSKTKADILSMLDRMIAQHGDAMSIPMLRVDQSDHLKLYTCALATGFLQAMICRLPRSLENPEGIQRALVMKKVSEIEERLSSGPYGFPNAIVITLRCQDSPYITVAPLESRTGDSSGIVLLTVALHRYREHIAACAADEAGYLLAPEQELLGYMIDGHHRTEGAYAAGKLDYPFLTGVYLDLDLRKMAASFAEINCNQEKPSAIHTNAMTGSRCSTAPVPALCPGLMSTPAKCRSCWSIGSRSTCRTALTTPLFPPGWRPSRLIFPPGRHVTRRPGTVPRTF